MPWYFLFPNGCAKYMYMVSGGVSDLQVSQKRPDETRRMKQTGSKATHNLTHNEFSRFYFRLKRLFNKKKS